MKKFIVGLMMVGLLAAAPPAMAQQDLQLTADPLGLIISGAVLPYVGGGANASFWEAYSPAFGPVSLHMFFFDPTCVRQGDSVGLDLTANDVEFVQVDNISPAAPSGLLTMAETLDGFTLVPLNTPVHSRVLWVNAAEGYVRTLEPITLNSWDAVSVGADDLSTWNPLRTAAAFWAPLEGGGLNTVIYLVCPNTNIISTAAPSINTAFSTQNGFPPLVPAPIPAGTPTPLLANIFDDEERFLRDTNFECNCFSQLILATTSTIYSDAASAPGGTYTEIVGGSVAGAPPAPPVCSTTEITPITAGNPCPADPSNPGFQFVLVSGGGPGAGQGPFSFTGYRSITAGPFDVFGRLSQAANCDVTAADCTANLR